MKFIVKVPVVAHVLVEVDFEDADQPEDIEAWAVDRVSDPYWHRVEIDEVLEDKVKIVKIVYEQDGVH